MNVPQEFTPEHVAAHSPAEEQLYRPFVRSGEPWKSLFTNNPWMIPPDPRKALEWGTGGYWDTTVARKHPYWSRVDLPVPTRDLHRMRSDLHEWGFALIQDGLSPSQCERFRDRLLEQAEGERLAGIETTTPSGQYIHTLINKGAIFGQCIEQDPHAVQAGPLIEQLLDEMLGKGWICHSFLSNGADPGGQPQGLHTDQAPLFPWIPAEAPALVNTMFIPEDVDDRNGGTLLVPGSHRILIEAGSGGEVGEMPPTINLEAPAGTILLFDGRLLHGTGVNRTERRRFVATMSNVKSWMRQQENWVLSVAADVLEQASPKLLHRMGLQAVTYGATVEGFGMGAQGRVGEPDGGIAPFRAAYDRGAYARIRELSKDSGKEDLQRPYTLGAVRERARAERKRLRAAQALGGRGNSTGVRSR